MSDTPQNTPPNLPLKDRRFIALAIAALMIILAALLNPSADRHREHIREAVAERSPLESALGVGAFTAFAAKYRSLGVVSYTTTDDGLVTIGFLGMVFFVD